LRVYKPSKKLSQSLLMLYSCLACSDPDHGDNVLLQKVSWFFYQTTLHYGGTR
jgi:hypothetical protein